MALQVMGITVENLFIPFFSFYLFVLCHLVLLLTLLPLVSFSLNSIYSESYKTMLYIEVCNKKVMIWSMCASKSYWHRYVILALGPI